MDVLGNNSRYVSCMITDHHNTFSIQWESNKDLGQVIDSLSAKASSSITVSHLKGKTRKIMIENVTTNCIVTQ